MYAKPIIMRTPSTLFLLLLYAFSPLYGQQNEFGFSSVRTGSLDSINAAANRSGYTLVKFESENCFGDSDSTLFTRIIALSDYGDSIMIGISFNSIASIEFETAIDNSKPDTLNLIAKPYGKGCFCSCNYLLYYTITGKYASQVLTFNSRLLEQGVIEYKKSSIQIDYYPSGRIKQKSWFFGDEIIKTIEYDENGNLLPKQDN